MRKRIRDWPITVYQYGIRLPFQSFKDLPLPVQQEADHMQALWNQMVDVFDAYLKDKDTILTSVPDVAQAQAQLNQAVQTLQEARSKLMKARQALRTKHHEQLLPLQDEIKRSRQLMNENAGRLKDMKALARSSRTTQLRELTQRLNTQLTRLKSTCPISWTHKDIVLERFYQTLKRLKGGGGAPKRRTQEPDHVHFVQRYTGGGIPFESWCHGRESSPYPVFGKSKRFNLVSISSESMNGELSQNTRRRHSRTTGEFEVNGTTLPLTLTLHRPIPSGSYVKSVALIGTRSVQAGSRHHPLPSSSLTPLPEQWSWQINMVVETPPQPAPVHNTRKTIAIDLGFRVLNRELHQVRIAEYGSSDTNSQSIILPSNILQSLKHCRDLQAEADSTIEAMRQIIQRRPWSDISENHIHDSLQQIHAIQGPRVLRLARALVDTCPHDERHSDLCLMIGLVSKHQREQAGLRRHTLGHRLWFYRNTAHHLCRQASLIILEDLDLRSLAQNKAEEDPQDPALIHGQFYRQCTGLSEFVAALKMIAPKHGTTIRMVNPAHTTTTCAQCGAVIQANFQELAVTCPNGHTIDQDRNAVRNLLQQGELVEL